MSEFDAGPLNRAIAESVRLAVADGRMQERAAIVAWLRRREQDRMYHLLPITDDIEVGEHVKSTRPAEPEGK